MSERARALRCVLQYAEKSCERAGERLRLLKAEGFKRTCQTSAQKHAREDDRRIGEAIFSYTVYNGSKSEQSEPIFNNGNRTTPAPRTGLDFCVAGSRHLSVSML